MDLNWIWKSILIVLAGTLLLRIAGRKSISQMTLAQTVIMIGIGSLLIQPLAGKNIWTTITVGAILVVTLVVMELLQVKFDKIEKFITGRAKVLINNGNLDEKGLKKVRLTVDQLEMKLRQNNVSSLNDVKWATLEPNGQIGFELKEDAKPALKKDLQMLQQQMNQMIMLLKGSTVPMPPNDSSKQDLFAEVARKSHTTEPPEQLQ
ncbi:MULTISPECIES: DUF421 domain-containing protein [Bacillus]|uniref:YetF C-terminal domain-containing protein n=2 Tax=Bacillus infantis TaxID=324767 RepID=U5LA83_9BACI|nr:MULTISPECIES: DUF421 domain-containing protein [Bacillus]OXT18207.1 DUF421 domain-containing protein [Bacillus sp. OG2]AGX04729.1 hypothetical protein N288_14145 [Bacillus infantis NRRL B-14911]MCK6205639.1 DUF421 domain-containing protein [Bacillus infantis]MCP1158818.1 DUF421 domain-containing protein [Bacillus infantis]RYI29514.1 DUF421 domain-containing protein [Bacillus infantis]